MGADRLHGTALGVGERVGNAALDQVLMNLKLLGEKVSPWNFEVEGVTSVSIDLHKYGYAAKGASTILYRTRELRQHQRGHRRTCGGMQGAYSRRQGTIA